MEAECKEQIDDLKKEVESIDPSFRMLVVKQKIGIKRTQDGQRLISCQERPKCVCQQKRRRLSEM